MTDKLVIIGQGYVGLPISMRAVEVGFDVVGYDIDDARMTRLARGESYIEDVSGPELRSALGTGRFTPTSSELEIAGFDYAVITVPTPLHESLPDLTFIEKAASLLAQHITPDSTVVLESTTYPGTTEQLMVPILEEGSGLEAGVDFYVGYSPERIDPGNTEFSFVNTPKVISGINAASLERVGDLYARLVQRTIGVSTPKEAELTKLLENTFRHVNIALVNELAVFARELGINVWEAIDAASTKPFGYMRFTPGPGVGGHCLPVDPSYLSWQVRRTLGRSFRFVDLANDVNEHMPDYVVQRVMAGLNLKKVALNGSVVVLVGLSYKKNTGDVRESPAVRVAELLLENGAVVRAVDPFVDSDRLGPSDVILVEGTPEDFDCADAIVILTDHDGVDYDSIISSSAFVLDTRMRLGGKREAL